MGRGIPKVANKRLLTFAVTLILTAVAMTAAGELLVTAPLVQFGSVLLILATMASAAIGGSSTISRTRRQY